MQTIKAIIIIFIQFYHFKSFRIWNTSFKSVFGCFSAVVVEIRFHITFIGIEFALNINIPHHYFFISGSKMWLWDDHITWTYRNNIKLYFFFLIILPERILIRCLIFPLWCESASESRSQRKRQPRHFHSVCLPRDQDQLVSTNCRIDM